MRKLILTIIVFLILISNAYALGVSPGRTTLEFHPNEVQEIGLKITNSEKQDMKVIIYTENDNSNLIKISQQAIDFKADEISKDIKIMLTMPQEMKPGINDIDLVIKQLPSEQVPSPLFVGANIAVISQIRIRVPYPGKYVEISDIDITNALANTTVQFNIPIINFGTENINEVWARIKIMGPTNEPIAEILTQKTSLESKNRLLLNAVWNSEKMNVGKYYAVADVFYDGKSANKEKVFSLGKLSIKVLRVETGNYNLGGIAKFTIWLESEWNERIDSLYGELDELNASHDIVANIKTPAMHLDPHTPAAMIAYWDTTGQKEGEYLMNLRLRYKGIEQDASLISDLTYNGIKTRIIGPTGEVVNTLLTGKTLLPIAVVLLIVINIILIAYYRRKNKNKYRSQPRNSFEAQPKK